MNTNFIMSISKFLDYIYLEKKSSHHTKVAYNSNLLSFEDFVKTNPTGYNAQDSMGEYYFMEKDYDNALVHYKKSIELYPGSTNGYNKVKEIDVLLGK